MAGHDVFTVVTTDGSGEGNIVVADLIDENGVWFAHGVGRSLWDGDSGLSWTLDSADPTMCHCAADQTEEFATCVWMDGTSEPSSEITCPPQ